MRNNESMRIEKYYALKAIFEGIWGKDTYLELKHCSELNVWKKYGERTLSASKLAIQENVLIRDEEWQKDANEIIAHGVERINGAESFDDLFQGLSATYIELSFHQLGRMPTRSPHFRAQLRKDHWKLGCYRTVQYVQNVAQIENLAPRKQRENRGSDE